MDYWILVFRLKININIASILPLVIFFKLSIKKFNIFGLTFIIGLSKKILLLFLIEIRHSFIQILEILKVNKVMLMTLSSSNKFCPLIKDI